MKLSGIITLTTDFGWRDPYVAAMKGAILSIHPEAVLVDVTHDIEPGSIREAADILLQTVPCFPPGTVHVGVVDPGVGTDRRALAAESGGRFLVGPDNGLFWPLLLQDMERRVVHVRDERFFRRPVSSTFHGRDVFAPVAAHLASGRDPHEMGDIIEDPVALDVDRPREEGGALSGEVTRVDRFGNLVTNISWNELAAFLQGREPRIRTGDLEVKGLRACYGDVPAGEALALIGSTGCLEVSVSGGRASDRVTPAPGKVQGMKVRVTASA
ncbi:MAG: SAM hydrolase/SAM-dependent halogenase family protein [Thermodesulfobacteriota bacterium]